MIKRLCASILVTLVVAQAASAGDNSRAAVLKSFEKGASWLVKTQNKNGSWGMIPGSAQPGEIGITALVVIGLAEAPDELRSKYREAAGKAVAYLLKYQQKNGSFTHQRSGLTTYRTALSLVAIKAYDAKAHAESVVKARKYLTETQFSEKSGVSPDNPHYGGWGYDKKGEKPDADLSNSSMALQALKASGLSPDDEAFKRALAFITRCQNNSETNKGVGKLKPKNDGGFIYDPGLNRNKSSAETDKDGRVSFESYAGMTYAGLMSLLYANVGKDDPRVKAAMRWIKEHFNLEINYGLGIRNKTPQANKQGLYYYYMTFAKCLDAYGSDVIETKEGKKNWSQELATVLLREQKPDGFWINEASERWWEGNPLIPTAYTLNALNRVLKHIPAKK